MDEQVRILAIVVAFHKMLENSLHVEPGTKEMVTIGVFRFKLIYPSEPNGKFGVAFARDSIGMSIFLDRKTAERLVSCKYKDIAGIILNALFENAS